MFWIANVLFRTEGALLTEPVPVHHVEQVFLSISFHFFYGQTPASFCFRSFQPFNRIKNCRLQRDSNSDRRNRRWARWSISHNLFCLSLFLSISIFLSGYLFLFLLCLHLRFFLFVLLCHLSLLFSIFIWIISFSFCLFICSLTIFSMF